MPQTFNNPYDNQIDQQRAWEHAQTWPDHILCHLTGETANGKKASLQHIESMLNQVEDLGPFEVQEWILFFEKLRVEGI
jgi:hypothetical protein